VRFAHMITSKKRAQNVVILKISVNLSEVSLGTQ